MTALGKDDQTAFIKRVRCTQESRKEKKQVYNIIDGVVRDLSTGKISPVQNNLPALSHLCQLSVVLNYLEPRLSFHFPLTTMSILFLLYMCVHVCVYACVHMHVCVYVCVSAFTHMYMCRGQRPTSHIFLHHTLP